jgi:hypothetical protein
MTRYYHQGFQYDETRKKFYCINGDYLSHQGFTTTFKMKLTTWKYTDYMVYFILSMIEKLQWIFLTPFQSKDIEKTFSTESADKPVILLEGVEETIWKIQRLLPREHTKLHEIQDLIITIIAMKWCQNKQSWITRFNKTIRIKGILDEIIINQIFYRF